MAFYREKAQELTSLCFTTWQDFIEHVDCSDEVTVHVMEPFVKCAQLRATCQGFSSMELAPL